MISTYALQVGFLSSLTIVKEGLSSTIVNEGLSLTNVYEGLSLTNVYEGLSLTNVYEGSNVCIRINLSLYDRPENCGYRLKCLISALVNLQIILIFSLYPEKCLKLNHGVRKLRNLSRHLMREIGRNSV